MLSGKSFLICSYYSSACGGSGIGVECGNMCVYASKVDYMHIASDTGISKCTACASSDVGGVIWVK